MIRQFLPSTNNFTGNIIMNPIFVVSFLEVAQWRLLLN